MGRPKSLDKKIHITFRLPQSVVDELKKIPNYNGLVERLIQEYLLKNK